MDNLHSVRIQCLLTYTYFLDNKMNTPSLSIQFTWKAVPCSGRKKYLLILWKKYFLFVIYLVIVLEGKIPASLLRNYSTQFLEKNFFFKSSCFLLRSHFKNHVRSYQQHQAANEMQCNWCKLIKQHQCSINRVAWKRKNEFLNRQEGAAHRQNHTLSQWCYFGSSSRELRITHPFIHEARPCFISWSHTSEACFMFPDLPLMRPQPKLTMHLYAASEFLCKE